MAEWSQSCRDRVRCPSRTTPHYPSTRVAARRSSQDQPVAASDVLQRRHACAFSGSLLAATAPMVHERRNEAGLGPPMPPPISRGAGRPSPSAVLHDAAVPSTGAQLGQLAAADGEGSGKQDLTRRDKKEQHWPASSRRQHCNTCNTHVRMTVSSVPGEPEAVSRPLLRRRRCAVNHALRPIGPPRPTWQLIPPGLQNVVGR